MRDKIEKTDAQWREQLTSEQYQVCRRKGTEPAFTGRFHDHKAKGVYWCVCCGEGLFRSEEKYDSGTGWPSFWRPVANGVIGAEMDRNSGRLRVEVHCRRCGSHLSHVFADGPESTGQRYCINSLSLEFEWVVGKAPVRTEPVVVNDRRLQASVPTPPAGCRRPAPPFRRPTHRRVRPRHHSKIDHHRLFDGAAVGYNPQPFPAIDDGRLSMTAP